jgi:glycosyltransferase involved in cell wall biosynthesis
MIKVSALVSVYKSMEFIDECLNDLIEQSLFKKGELEIVIIDSASPENESAIIQKYQAQYPNIVYNRTAEREPLYKAWNRGIALARGEFVTNANTDDRHHPECLEILCKALEASPKIDLVYADVFESDTANQTFHQNPGTKKYTYPDFFAPLSLMFYQFGCQPLWRKKIHSLMGDFNGKLKAAGDWEFCLRFSLAGLKARRVPQILGSFLQRATSISNQDSTSNREQADLRNTYLTAKNILALYQIEGWDSSCAQGQAEIFTDFAKRAATLRLPWSPGQNYFDPQGAILGTSSAFDIFKSSPRTLWNLGIALFLSAQEKEGSVLLKEAIQKPDSEVADAAKYFLSGKCTHAPLVNIN